MSGDSVHVAKKTWISPVPHVYPFSADCGNVVDFVLDKARSHTSKGYFRSHFLAYFGCVLYNRNLHNKDVMRIFAGQVVVVACEDD